MVHAFIDTLQDPAVRDLAWVIGSPGIIDASYPDYLNRVVDDAWCNAQLKRSTGWLTALDRQPLPLHQFIAARPTRRLGLYFETLIAFWLTHIPDTHIVAHNLQVQDEQRTLGEYDFLFRNASAEVCHWEAAVKFYLQLESSTEQRSFIGPGTRDRLDLKLDRVFKHQLLLGQTPAGIRALPGDLKLDKAQAFVKGYLFYHTAELNKLEIAGISAAHLTGWWVHHTVEPVPQTSLNSHWIIPTRLHWLAPGRLPADATVMTYSELQSKLEEHFSLNRDALLLFEMTRNTTGNWHEISRGFVVYSTWPTVDSPLRASPTPALLQS